MKRYGFLWTPLVLFLLVLGTACQQQADPGASGEAGDGTMAETDAEGWLTLAAGPDYWRGYRSESLPEAWAVEDDVLYFSGEGEGGDIISKAQFDNFELELEWKISEGGNSGIMFRVS